MSKTVPSGVLISGICKGIRKEEFNGRQYQYLGIAQHTQDAYGDPREFLEEVSIFGDSAAGIALKASESIGKHVVMSVIKRAQVSKRTGKAYMQTMLRRDSELLVLS